MMPAEVLVYVGTYTSDTEEGIYCFRMNEATGRLTPAGVTKPITNPFHLTIGRSGHVLYATISLLPVSEGDPDPEGEVAAFAVDSGTGDLTPLNSQPTGGTFPCYLELDRSESFILVGNYNSGSVAVLTLDEAGLLGDRVDHVQHSGSSVNETRQQGPHIHSVVLDPQQRFAYAADLGIDRQMIYAFDASMGNLVPAAQPWAATAAGAGPRHFAFHPNSNFAYLLNELDNTLTTFAYDNSTGALKKRQTLSTLPAGFSDENYAADLQVLPSGKFLYSSNRGHDTIAVFAVDSETGQLAEVAHEPAGGSWPWNLEIALDGRFLLTANYESNNISVCEIDSVTGRLQPTGYGVDVPKPTCVIVGPATAG